MALRTVSESEDDEEDESSSCLLRLLLRSFFFLFFFESADLCLRFLFSERRCFLFVFEWRDLFVLLLSLESEEDDLPLLRDGEETELRRSCFRRWLRPRGERERWRPRSLDRRSLHDEEEEVSDSS
ncbi:hypothetical protein PHYPSEUDO_006969 [Phytophthora pseudosyringae]|uniref:Uncharacterized protein n=1 Tax=Phytophthora pseudosyringae TaxID=221518 RepID=A0A8T1VKB7_9STRA|nr:hypothetical protein PHYPSEUDO_006969 [Phytophthora pseudosyringae]